MCFYHFSLINILYSYNIFINELRYNGMIKKWAFKKMRKKS
jgi:hypothetical protein